MKILVLGSSATLSIRPPRKNRSEGNYSDLLQVFFKERNLSGEVINMGRGSSVITDFKDYEISDMLKQINPDVIIIHYGINEAAPRAVSRNLWRWLFMSRRRCRLKHKIANIIHRLSPFLIKKFNLKSWVSPKVFGETLKDIQNIIKKEIKSHVIVFNIGPANEHFKQMLPGIEKQILKFNETIRQVACGESFITHFDIHELVCVQGIEKTQPDGAHFSAFGHRLVAQKIIEILKKKNLLVNDKTEAVMQN